MRPISDAGPKGRWPYQKLSSERASSNGAPPLAMRAMTLAKPVRSAPALQWMRMGSERPSRRSMSATRSGREGSLSGIRSRLRKSTPCRSATSSSRRYQWRSSFSPLRFRMDLSPCRRIRSSSSSGESWPLRYTRSGTTARKLSPKREAPSVRRLRTTRPPRDPTAAFLVIAALFYAAFLRESRRTRAMAHGVQKNHDGGGPGSLGEISRVSRERLAVALVIDIDGNLRDATKVIQIHPLFRRLQPQAGGDHQSSGNTRRGIGENPGIGQLSTEVEAADEREKLSESGAPRGAQS